MKKEKLVTAFGFIAYMDDKNYHYINTQLTRLYEQGADSRCIEVYQTRWWHWLRSGLPKHTALVKQKLKPDLMVSAP